MSTTLVFIGPHGAGKSTVARLVAGALGWPCLEEIGDTLRREALRLDPGASAEKPQEDFDRAVFRRELARDRRWRGAGPRVVESWHPANLAYARQRGFPRIERVEGVLRGACAVRGPVVVQPVSARPAVLARRQREPGDLAFFAAVARDAEDLARRWGLVVLPGLDTSDDPPGVSAELVLARLAHLEGAPSRGDTTCPRPRIVPPGSGRAWGADPGGVEDRRNDDEGFDVSTILNQ